MSETILLKRLIEDLAKLRKSEVDPKAWQAWRTDTALMLGKSFGSESGQVRVFERLAQGLDLTSEQAAKTGNADAFRKGLDSLAVILRSAVEESGDEDDDEPAEAAGSKPKTMLPEIAVLCEGAHPLRKALADFLKPWNAQMFFIREHTNYGQVPLEHMVNWKRIGHTVVVWEGDLRTALETGFLLGRLGMKMVTVLHAAELSNPESFAQPILLSGGDGWHAPLGAALRETGYVPADS